MEAKGLVVDEYFKDAQTPQEMRDQFTEIVGDYWMVVPAIKEAGYYLGMYGQFYLTCHGIVYPVSFVQNPYQILSFFKQMWGHQCTCMSFSTGQRPMSTPGPVL